MAEAYWQFRCDLDVLDQALTENLKALNSLVLFRRWPELTGAIRYELTGRHPLDPAAIHRLVAEIVSEGTQATVRPTIEEMEEAVQEAVASLRAVGSSEVGHIRLRKLRGDSFGVFTEIQDYGPERRPRRSPTPEEREYFREPEDSKERHRRIAEINKRITDEVEEDYRQRLEHHRIVMGALFNRLKKDGPVGGPYLWPAKASGPGEAPATEGEPPKEAPALPRVPKRLIHLHRWRLAWKYLKPFQRKGTSQQKMAAWLKKMHPGLKASSPDTVGKICRAGMEGLLDE